MLLTFFAISGLLTPHFNNCVNNLVADFTGNSVLSINFDGYLQTPVIRTSSGGTTLSTDITIINLNGLSLLATLNSTTLNPRGTTIIITDRANSSIFKTAARYYLQRLVVVETSGKIYSYQPYKRGSVDNPTTGRFLIGTCNSTVTTDFKIPQKWPRTTITALNNIIPPYSICPTCPTNRGIEIEAFEVVAKHLQLHVKYTRTDFVYWGSKVNGTYSHILGELQRREGDLTIGVFHSKFDEHLDFDTTFNYMEDGTKWLVPKARIFPYWKRLSLVFAAEVYWALGLSTVTMMVACKVLYAGTSWMMLYQILLEVSLKELPGKSLLMLWIGSSLVLSTMFKSKLVDIMSKQSYERQIDTLSDIVASKLHIFIDHDIAKFYQDSTSADEEYVRNHYEFCTNPRVCINRTAFVQDAVTVDFERSNSFFFTDFVDEDGDILIHLFKTPIFPVHIRLFFVKGHPIFPQVDQLLMRMRDSGVIQRLYDDASYKAKLAMAKKSSFKAEVLNVEQMEVAFLVWGCGVVTALVVFGGELLSNLKKWGNFKTEQP